MRGPARTASRVCHQASLDPVFASVEIVESSMPTDLPQGRGARTAGSSTSVAAVVPLAARRARRDTWSWRNRSLCGVVRGEHGPRREATLLHSSRPPSSSQTAWPGMCSPRTVLASYPAADQRRSRWISESSSNSVEIGPRLADHRLCCQHSGRSADSDPASGVTAPRTSWSPVLSGLASPASPGKPPGKSRNCVFPSSD